MAMIYVKVKPGRRAITQEGREIPADNFMGVPDTPYVRRLIFHHEDVEVEGGTEQLKKPPTAPQAGPASRPTAPRPESPVTSPKPAKE